MKILTALYEDELVHLPAAGQQIIAHQSGDELVVYQAYRPAIADFAVENQVFGGPDYSFNRMSWIKPNFLWMMYRSGWAQKEGQERVLAIWIAKSDFLNILENAALSTYHKAIHSDQEMWKSSLKTKDVRLQWDPDHDPFGRKVERRAIQLGLKGDLLRHFGTRAIRRIEDVSEFVKEQKHILDTLGTAALKVPIERVLKIDDASLQQRTGIDLQE